MSPREPGVSQEIVRASLKEFEQTFPERKPANPQGKVENSHWQRTSGRMLGAQSVGLLPDSLFGNEGRFEFARIGHGCRARLMISSSFSRSSREGFWPERVRKKT